jgi:hypothetical protein
VNVAEQNSLKIVYFHRQIFKANRNLPGKSFK